LNLRWIEVRSVGQQLPHPFTVNLVRPAWAKKLHDTQREDQVSGDNQVENIGITVRHFSSTARCFWISARDSGGRSLALKLNSCGLPIFALQNRPPGWSLHVSDPYNFDSRGEASSRRSYLQYLK